MRILGLFPAEHGTDYNAHASGKAANGAKTLSLGQESFGPLPIAASSRSRIFCSLESSELRVNMISLDYLGETKTQYRHTNRRDEVFPKYPTSRTLIVLRAPTDEVSLTESKIFSVLSGLGGIFTLVVGTVGVCVNLCGCIKPLPGVEPAIDSRDGPTAEPTVEMKTNPMPSASNNKVLTHRTRYRESTVSNDTSSVKQD